MVIEEIDRAIAEERFAHARELARSAPAELSAAEGWSLALRRARLDQDDHEIAVDEPLLRLDALLLDANAVADELALAHSLRVRGWMIKRSRAMVEEVVKAAREAVGPHPKVLIEEGRAWMRFDERERARECFVEALKAGGTDAAEARLALADALYVLGDFDGALEELAAIDDEAVMVAALRMRASCLAARRDHEGEAEAWREVLERRPSGDRAQGDRVAYALALAAAGKRRDAFEQLGTAWRQDPRSGQGSYARQRMQHLERHMDGGRSARLAAFPTTAQKWNYCGPAVLELCLRYLQVELTQDEIASVVKRERGTPMYEIATFLSAHSIEARRIEATRERLMAALDLGLPVIVQEEYSTTSHVAVLTGYDEALGTFLAQDPATHRPIVKSFEFTERSGDLFGNGAIIVLGRAGDALDARRRACDEAGLIDAPHLGILDDADRMRPSAVRDGREGATTAEILRRCDEAIALAPRFKLAWHRRVVALQSQYRASGKPEHRDQMLADLRHVRTTFANDEWPHQLHAEWLMDRNLIDEAFVEYLEASRRDPGDSRNRGAMGECMWLCGDLERAEKYLLEALAIDPTYARGAENLAAVYVREVVERRREAKRPIETALSPSKVFERIKRTDDDLITRAKHLSRYVRAEHPWNPFDHEVAGDLAALEGDWAAAEEAYGKARELDGRRPWACLGHAVALRELGKLEEAQQAVEALASSPRAPVRAYTLLADVREALGDVEGAARVLSDAMAMGAPADSLAPALFRLRQRKEGAEAAAARLRELAEQRTGDAPLVRAVGQVLDDENQRGHAIALMRRVVAGSPGDVDSVWRLGRLLSDDVMTRAEGERLLERVIELAPDFTGARIRLAFSVVGADPERAMALLEPLGGEDAYVLETRAALLERIGRADESSRVLERALATWGDPERALIRLTDWHVESRRYDRALALARLLPSRVTSTKEQREAERTWLVAFRLGGAMREAEPRLRALCAEGVPSHLAWNAYWGMRSIDSKLAADAAAAVSSWQTGQSKTTWLLRAAGSRAKGGDDAELVAMERELDSAESWAQLAYCYEDLERYEEANRAADRAMELDGTHLEALNAMESAHVRRGDVAAAIACARRLSELHPYEHAGPERLAMLLAQSLEIEEALACSHRAVDAAPFCHNAHWARAAALFVADDLENAERHARRRLALEEAEREDEANGALMLVYALEGKIEALERCFARTYAMRPSTLFPRFDDKLRALARSRA